MKRNKKKLGDGRHRANTQKEKEINMNQAVASE
jgi:hypothetical protein